MATRWVRVLCSVVFPGDLSQAAVNTTTQLPTNGMGRPVSVDAIVCRWLPLGHRIIKNNNKPLAVDGAWEECGGLIACMRPPTQHQARCKALLRCQEARDNSNPLSLCTRKRLRVTRLYKDRHRHVTARRVTASRCKEAVIASTRCVQCDGAGPMLEPDSTILLVIPSSYWWQCEYSYRYSSRTRLLAGSGASPFRL